MLKENISWKGKRKRIGGSELLDRVAPEVLTRQWHFPKNLRKRVSINSWTQYIETSVIMSHRTNIEYRELCRFAEVWPLTEAAEGSTVLAVMGTTGKGDCCYHGDTTAVFPYAWNWGQFQGRGGQYSHGTKKLASTSLTHFKMVTNAINWWKPSHTRLGNPGAADFSFWPLQMEWGWNWGCEHWFKGFTRGSSAGDDVEEGAQCLITRGFPDPYSWVASESETFKKSDMVQLMFYGAVLIDCYVLRKDKKAWRG